MQGTLTWPLKNVSKHQLPITVMSLGGLASASPSSQWPPNKPGDLGTALTSVKRWLKKTGWLRDSDVGHVAR